MRRDVRYFAWVRERIGESGETITSEARTPGELIAELRRQGPRHAAAFNDLTALRVAVDQELVDFDTPLGDAREIAFFPPMTGG
ncbi:MAG: molybdopterin converting factor subunit 1 [Pseudomonadota bacterium]